MSGEESERTAGESGEEVVRSSASADVRVIEASEVTEQAVEVLFEKRPRLVKSRVVTRLEELGEAIGRAEAEAARIREDARREAAAFRERIRNEAEAEAHRECLELMGRAQALHDRAIEDAQRDLVDMAFKLAERLVGTALEFEPELIGAMVEDIVRRARGRRQITVLTHPEDAAVLERERERLSDAAGGARVLVQTSDEISRGGCILRSESGEVDARLETRLEAVRGALMGGGE